MGDAKRRKALGLMPTVLPFTVMLSRNGDMTPLQMPTGTTEQEQILSTLLKVVSSHQRWDQLYRTEYVMAGLPSERLSTREDIEQIPVPTLRRIEGDLAIWPAQVTKPPAEDIKVDGTENTWLHLHKDQYAAEADSSTWFDLPRTENPEEMLSYLFQHPALQLEGEEVARYLVEQAQGGDPVWTPQPPAEQLEQLTKLASEWHGETPEEWATIHADRLAEDGESEASPQSLRSGFVLRQPAPLRSFFSPPFDEVGNLDFFAIRDQQSYTLDGKTWSEYPDTGELDLMGGDDENFNDFNDVETFSATVWQDGRMEWPKEALDANNAQTLTNDLMLYTGAGTPEAWAKYTKSLLESFYELEDSIGEAPQVQAIKISVPTELYAEEGSSNSFEAQVIEDEVTFDGETWYDLYEALPDDLFKQEQE